MDLLKQQYPVEQQYLVKKQNTETQKIILLQLGDAGLNFCMDERDQKLKKELQDKIDELKTEGIYIQILFVRGNHEARPGNMESGNLDRYIEKEVYGGRAYIENNPKGPAFPDLIFLKDGEIYSIPDGEERKDFLAIGGGRSLDFFERFLKGMEENNIKLENPEVTLFMIIELTSSTCFSCIMKHEPLSIKEYKPYLYYDNTNSFEEIEMIFFSYFLREEIILFH